MQCREIPAIGKTDDDTSQWVAGMVDQYTECAIRHNTLIKWVEGKDE